MDFILIKVSVRIAFKKFYPRMFLHTIFTILTWGQQIEFKPTF